MELNFSRLVMASRAHTITCTKGPSVNVVRLPMLNFMSQKHFENLAKLACDQFELFSARFTIFEN